MGHTISEHENVDQALFRTKLEGIYLILSQDLTLGVVAFPHLWHFDLPLEGTLTFGNK